MNKLLYLADTVFKVLAGVFILWVIKKLVWG